ncbi:hypothetical protein [Candidatus Poriferisocius sp.]|uniref:hypothetical protein n=1 Tax=Candidatus Poriferisocius sp. TaxID=3101276 RepID=UPI003B521146
MDPKNLPNIDTRTLDTADAASALVSAAKAEKQYQDAVRVEHYRRLDNPLLFSETVKELVLEIKNHIGARGSRMGSDELRNLAAALNLLEAHF